MIHGPDVSSYQKVIRYQEVAASCDFAIVKVTEGNSSTNARAEEQVLGFASAGMLVMIYHFAQPNGPNWLADAAAEAQRLEEKLDALEQKLGKQLFGWLDTERNTALTPQEAPLWRDWDKEFRRVCVEKGRPIGFYSGKYFTTSLRLSVDWNKTLLWLAQYPANFRADCNYGFWPTAIYPWARADIWQHGGGDPKPFGNESTCPGVDGQCDMNSFAGSRDELEQLISVAA